MKFFKYTFVFFLLTLNLRLYSANNNNIINVYNVTNIIHQYNANEIPIDEDNYKPDNADFWKQEASKTDDTYSFGYWLSNVSVLGTGLCCILCYFLFPEWFLLLATILGLLYIIHFFVQIISPTARFLLNLKSKEEFSKSVGENCKLVVRSSITIEHEKRVKKEGGSEEKLEAEKEVENGELTIPITPPDNVGVKKLGDDCNMNLHKGLINLNIELGQQLKNRVDIFLNEQIKKTQRGFRCPSGCNGKHKIKRDVSWSVLGVGKYMLIADNISDKPWHVGFLWFSLFTILPFSQFYKLWLNRYCDVEELSITYTQSQY